MLGTVTIRTGLARMLALGALVAALGLGAFGFALAPRAEARTQWVPTAYCEDIRAEADAIAEIRENTTDPQEFAALGQQWNTLFLLYFNSGCGVWGA
jgi:hypothetical protein